MKILVNLSVPAISENFDILIPDDMRICGIVPLLAETVEEMSDKQYVASGGECLCSVEKQMTFRDNVTLAQYGVRNGDHLVMI